MSSGTILTGRIINKFSRFPPIRLGFTIAKESAAVRFSGFDGVRAIAALAVIIHHIEQFKSELGLPSIWMSSVIQSLGTEGVNLFFVLSGFLISHLLIKETAASGSISLKNFYLRRAFRILPLYCLILFLAFGPLPHLIAATGGKVGAYVTDYIWQRNVGYLDKLSLFLTMLPNLSLILYPAVLFAGQTWSLGVEEQFYLLWPVLLKWSGRRKWVPMLMALSAKSVLYLILITVLQSQRDLHWAKPLSLTLEYLKLFRLEYMAIGGLGAYLYFERPDFVRRYLTPSGAQLLALPGLLAILCFGTSFPEERWSVPLLSTWAILCLIENPYRFFNLGVPWLSALGKISYGFYMFNGLAIVLCLRLAEGLSLFQGSALCLNLYLYVACPFAAMGVAKLSYVFFESPFLLLKEEIGKTVLLNRRLESPRSLPL